MANYVVIGLGGSGLSAAKFLVAKGHTVTVTDENIKPKLADKLPKEVLTSFGAIDGEKLIKADVIVISPGINPQIAEVANAKGAGVPVMSDVWLFVQALQQRDVQAGKKTPIVAITGSNAKSTVTTLVGEMAKQAGKTVGVGGNIGTPALDLLEIANLDMVVLELSSFQLEHIEKLGASVATILNLSADHLDRHGDMAGYLAQKLRIFDQAASAVICLDDENLANSCQETFANIGQSVDAITTSGQIGNPRQADFYLSEENQQIYLNYQGQQLLSANELLIRGKHNLLNALSALALGQSVNLPMESMLSVLRTFRGLPHRCEFVANSLGKDYYNDSKGTNIGSTIAAIEGLGMVYGEKSLALILGGQAKGQDFSELGAFVAKFASVVYLIGQDANLIEQGLLSISHDINIVQAQTLDNAIAKASQSDAKAVLLSPACASFDQFDGYHHRGEVFVRLVQGLSNDE